MRVSVLPTSLLVLTTLLSYIECLVAFSFLPISFRTNRPTRRVGISSNDDSSLLTSSSSSSSSSSFTLSKTKRCSLVPLRQSSSSSSIPTETSIPLSSTESNQKPKPYYDAIICGGGPAGLLTAIMLTQKFGSSYKIAICERRSAIPPSPSDETVWNDIARFYLLGIGHRGQRALETFGIMDDFLKASVEVKGRRDWQPGKTKPSEGVTTPARKDVKSRILPRDKLVGVLHEHLVENYIEQRNANIDLLYGYEITPIDFGPTTTTSSSSNISDKEDDVVSVRITKCQDTVVNENKDGTTTTSSSSYTASQDASEECDVDASQLATTKWLIGADGAARTVATAMEEFDLERYRKLNPFQKLVAKRPFHVTKFQDDNPRFYKSIPILLPSDWPQELNYSARSNRITLEALPSDHKGNLCALLLMKPDDELAQPNVEPIQLRSYFEEHFPQFGALIDDDEMARVAEKPASRLPVFRYAGPRLHLGSRTLVLGDAAHTVKPYYGLGANTALEDVQILSEILDETMISNDDQKKTANEEELKMDPIPQTVQEFSKRRAADSEALVTISRNMDRPGKLFFFTFVLPLILDGIFHKLAPAIFSENIFGMFQKKNIGFKQIQTKKRLDRVIQIVCLSSVATGAGLLMKSTIGAIARVTGQSQKVVSLGMLLVGILGNLWKKSAMKKTSSQTA